MHTVMDKIIGTRLTLMVKYNKKIINAILVVGYIVYMVWFYMQVFAIKFSSPYFTVNKRDMVC